MPTEPYDAFLVRRLPARAPGFERFHADLADLRRWARADVDAQANRTDREAPARLEPVERDGRAEGRLVLDPVYDAQHREVYARGVIARPHTEGAPHLWSFAAGYLLSQADISLHCPVTLTGAVAYVLEHFADAGVRDAFLPLVTRTDGTAFTGGTWATERHGGSDVGATTTEARPRADGTVELHGLKWFASNATSGLALATARPVGAPGGSAGLGLYLVPSRDADGRANYRVRRLKDKLGTRGLPTGEIDLLGARAHEVAPPPRGFALMLEALTYSRVHNAVGAAGSLRRSLDEALGWARERRAFGRAIVAYPMVRETLVDLARRTRAATLLGFEAALALDAAPAAPEGRAWLRFATALAKYLTAEDAVDGARAALELVGGNAYTNDLPLARLLRDAQVLTVWEGPANIQALELLRLVAPARGGFEAYEARLAAVLGAAEDGSTAGALAGPARVLRARLNEDRRARDLTLASPEAGARLARRLLHRLAHTLALGLLVEDAARFPDDAEALAFARLAAEALEPPPFGEEDGASRAAVLAALPATALPEPHPSPV